MHFYHNDAHFWHVLRAYPAGLSHRYSQILSGQLAGHGLA